jgi:Putative lumazine-binding
MLNAKTNSTRSRRAATVLAAGLALVAVGGCGPFGSDEDDVKDVVQDYTEGVAEGDGGKVCDTLAEDSRKQFEQAGTKCEDAFKSFGAFLNEDQKDKLKDVDPEVDVEGDNATAKVDELEGTGSTEVKLKKEDGDWKITFEQ